MARQARQTASSGVYHVILRSVENRPLLLSAADGAGFLTVLETEKLRDAMDIFAYCLKTDAFHLVLREGLSGLTNGVMRIARAWATRVNNRQKETGKLFAGRFYSVPLETPELILDATRFLHRMPLSFGEDMNYSLSSYKSFFKKSELLNSEEIFSLLGGAIDYRVYCDGECENVFKK